MKTTAFERKQKIKQNNQQNKTKILKERCRKKAHVSSLECESS
jgi:hypothetical protein